MNDVLQFTGIAGPAVGLQRPLRLLADQLHRQVQTLAVDPDKIFGQRQDVARLLAQCRQIEAALAQVMIKTLVEFPGSHGLRQIDTGGGDQTHIDRARLLRAHSRDFVIFKGRQQLDLDRQRQVADLVQVQGAAIGRTEPSRAAADRPTVGSGGIAEQFGIGVCRADGTAVH